MPLPCSIISGCPHRYAMLFCRGASPLVGVLAKQLVHAADLAFPTLVLPRTAHRENTAKPRRFLREVFQLLAVAELHDRLAPFSRNNLWSPANRPSFQSWNSVHTSTDKRRDSSDGAHHQVVRPCRLCGIEGEAPLRNFAHQNFVAQLEVVQRRRGLALGHQFKKRIPVPFRREKRRSSTDAPAAARLVQRRASRIGPEQT